MRDRWDTPLPPNTSNIQQSHAWKSQASSSVAETNAGNASFAFAGDSQPVGTATPLPFLFGTPSSHCVQGQRRGLIHTLLGLQLEGLDGRSNWARWKKARQTLRESTPHPPPWSMTGAGPCNPGLLPQLHSLSPSGSGPGASREGLQCPHTRWRGGWERQPPSGCHLWPHMLRRSSTLSSTQNYCCPGNGRSPSPGRLLQQLPAPLSPSLAPRFQLSTQPRGTTSGPAEAAAEALSQPCRFRVGGGGRGCSTHYSGVLTLP